MELPLESPIYAAHESKSRALVPKVASLFVLSFIFYLGVLLNVSLFETQCRTGNGAKNRLFNLIIASYNIWDWFSSAESKSALFILPQ